MNNEVRKVKVKLTEFGINILKNNYYSFIKHHPELVDVVGKFHIDMDEDGYTEFELFELMNIFGSYLNTDDLPYTETMFITNNESFKR